jgi:hypothetical protein
MGAEMALRAETRWKELMDIVDESGRTFRLDCGWGVTPPVAYIPYADTWKSCVPVWLRERRDDVIRAIESAGHVAAEGRYEPLWVTW